MSDLAKLSAAERGKLYWQENLRLIVILLAIWFSVSFLPVPFIPALNTVVIAGFPLGYYMGSQGSLIVFVVEIFYYAYAMNKLDEKYGVIER
jgi:putative solute:sodium symporter small subunit